MCLNIAPVLPPVGPLFRDVHHGPIQHFEEAVVCEKHGFRLGYLPGIPIEDFYGVGRVNQPPHLLRILEVGTQDWPGFPTGLRDFGIFLVPALRAKVSRASTAA